MQPILISILASGNPTGEILLNWFNAGFLSLTMLTFYCNGYSVEDVFVNIPSKKIQYKLANESGVLVANSRESLLKDVEFMKNHSLFHSKAHIRITPAIHYLFFNLFATIIGFTMKTRRENTKLDVPYSLELSKFV